MNNIPKTCYLYWNNTPMSYLNVVTVLSFHKYNPDWRIVVYLISKKVSNRDNERNYQGYKDYTGKDYFYMLEKLPYVEINTLNAFRHSRIHSILISDIWRRRILYSNGGVYSDFDVVWLKPMSEFVNIECIGNPNDFESIVSFYNYTDGFHNVSNLISEKGSPYLYSLIDAVNIVRPPYSDQAFGTELLNTMYSNLKSITDIYPRILAIKYETFYPYSIYNLDNLYNNDDLSYIDNKNVMCVHWFNGHLLSKEYVNNERKECSMTSILRREGYDIS